MGAQNQAKSHASSEARADATSGKPQATASHVVIPVGNIEMGKRQRPIDRAHVENLKVSMRENGFSGSILVRPLQSGGSRWLMDEVGGLGTTKYRLVFGAHRLVAATEIGLQVIPATVRVLTDDEALQLEIDENLVRRGLTPLERAEGFARRLEVWARRFPDRVVAKETQAPKRGRPSNSDKMSQFLGGAPTTMGFAADTAAELGLSARTIERGMRMLEGLGEATRDSLRGTWIASNEGVLRQLAALGDAEAQAGAIEVLLAGQTKNVLDARAIAAGQEPAKPAQTPVDVTVKAFRKLWGDATPSARAAILHELTGKKLPDGWTVTGGAA